MEGIDNIDLFDMGKRISIDIGTEMQIEIEGVEFRLKSVFIGMDPGGEYLILKFPYVSGSGGVGIQDKLYTGNQVVVRYLQAGAIFGFQAKLLGVTSAPKKLIFISYPRIIEEHNVRSEKRISCFLPARTKVDDKENRGAVLDMSRHGCRYVVKHSKVRKTKDLFQVDGQIELAFQLPGMEGEQSLTGTIRNVRKDGDELSVGIEFGDVDSEAKARISEFFSAAEYV